MSYVRVVLDYVHPWPNAAGFFVARDRGWYASEGLEVELRNHDYGWGDTLHYIARGQAEFGVAPPNRLFVRREAGDALVAVAAVNQEGLEAVQVRSGSGIVRPRQLEGRRVGYATTARGRAAVRTIVAADGGDPDKVVSVDTGTTELTPEFLWASAVDATFGGYWAWDALSPDGRPPATAMWPIRQLGLPPFHGYVLVASEGFCDENPQLVRAFLSATSRGFLAAGSDQAGTVALMQHVVPYIGAWRLARSLALVSTTWSHDGVWGTLRDKLVHPYAQWLASHDILNAPELAGDAVTNDFLPGPRLVVGSK